MSKMENEKLIKKALEARTRAVAPYSGFNVGAALLSEDGGIFTGCNIENSTYGLTVCAERVAIFKALSEGVRKFKSLAIAADSQELTPPCGACRQIIWEFCGPIKITLVNLKGETKSYNMSDLLPHPFDSKFFKV